MTVPPSDNHDPFNTSRPTVYRLKAWQWVLLLPVAVLLWLYHRSLRVRIDPGERALLEQVDSPRFVLTWHNRSLVIPEVLRRLLNPGRFACLVSPSKAAAWEVALFEFLGFPVVRGSTTRRSIQAGIELLRAMRKGMDTGLTPDGPSGPLYCFHEGAAILGRKAGVPLILLVPNCRWAIRLGTWDRHLVPLPFARVEVRIRVIFPNDPVWEQEAADIAGSLRRVCLELTEDPFNLCDHE